MRQDMQGAKIERVGEGIKITFDSGLLFEIDKSDCEPAGENEHRESRQDFEQISRHEHPH